MIKPRKAPIKVEPKVFFANERTFLAWMHISIVLAGASIAILAFSSSEENIGKQIYGLIMLPVAISFIVYAMYQCKFFVVCVRVNVFFVDIQILNNVNFFFFLLFYRLKKGVHDPK
jgi:hypothetical protein